jgi:hypothetical protein
MKYKIEVLRTMSIGNLSNIKTKGEVLEVDEKTANFLKEKGVIKILEEIEEIDTEIKADTSKTKRKPRRVRKEVKEEDKEDKEVKE